MEWRNESTGDLNKRRDRITLRWRSLQTAQYSFLKKGCVGRVVNEPSDHNTGGRGKCLRSQSGRKAVCNSFLPFSDASLICCSATAPRKRRRCTFSSTTMASKSCTRGRHFRFYHRKRTLFGRYRLRKEMDENRREEKKGAGSFFR